jgi:hypothetical protein
MIGLRQWMVRESRHARSAKLRQFAFLFIVGVPLAAQAADEPASVGIVGNVENEAKVVSGDTVTAAIIGTPVHLRDELRTGGAPQGHLP